MYALGMARAAFEGLRALAPEERPFLFSRSGWAGMQRYGGSWSGDVATGWPGLRASLSLVMGLGLCGVPYSGPDVGGSTGARRRSCTCAGQLASYLPLFRTHASLRAGRREPWEFGDEVLEHARVALAERRRLLPYFVTLAHLARRTGAPYVRPWWSNREPEGLRGRVPARRQPPGGAGAGGGVRRRTVLLPRDAGTTRRPRWRIGGRRTWRWTPRWGAFRCSRARGRAARAGPGRWSRAGGVGAGTRPVRGGLVVPDAGDGWAEPEIERYVTRWKARKLVIRRDGEGDGGEPARPVRLRGWATHDPGRGAHVWPAHLTSAGTGAGRSGVVPPMAHM